MSTPNPTPKFEIVPGSIAAMIEAGQLNAPPIMVIMIDISSSMNELDARYNGRLVTRYEAAKQQLIELQARHPGQIAIIAFGDEATACPGGVPPLPSGWTQLHLALAMAREADTGTMKFLIISDGLPQLQHMVEAEAELFTVPIDVILVGKDRNGERFLNDFATKTGGTFYTDTSTMLLTTTITKMLTVGPDADVIVT
jgi:hypothetical protein